MYRRLSCLQESAITISMKKSFRGLFLFDRCVYRLWRIIRWFKERVESERNRGLMLRLASCGKGVGLSRRIVIHSPKNVAIGNNVHIGDNAWIQGNGGLWMGDNCHISRNFTLYTANHCYGGNRLPYDEVLELKPVVIGQISTPRCFSEVYRGNTR
jgi:acetyltransferase-like isoleucine patch superfamily enzyme